jgi:hypothetical protein
MTMMQKPPKTSFSRHLRLSAQFPNIVVELECERGLASYFTALARQLRFWFNGILNLNRSDLAVHHGKPNRIGRVLLSIWTFRYDTSSSCL